MNDMLVILPNMVMGSWFSATYSLVERWSPTSSTFIGGSNWNYYASPTAGLWTAQTDEQEMGVSYHQLDAYLQGKPVPAAAANRIQHLHQGSEHKRQLPKAPPVVLVL